MAAIDPAEIGRITIPGALGDFADGNLGGGQQIGGPGHLHLFMPALHRPSGPGAASAGQGAYRHLEMPSDRFQVGGLIEVATQVVFKGFRREELALVTMLLGAAQSDQDSGQRDFCRSHALGQVSAMNRGYGAQAVGDGGCLGALGETDSAAARQDAVRQVAGMGAIESAIPMDVGIIGVRCEDPRLDRRDQTEHAADHQHRPAMMLVPAAAAEEYRQHPVVDSGAWRRMPRPAVHQTDRTDREGRNQAGHGPMVLFGRIIQAYVLVIRLNLT